jgi:hypothetical protein
MCFARTRQPCTAPAALLSLHLSTTEKDNAVSHVLARTA